MLGCGHTAKTEVCTPYLGYAPCKSRGMKSVFAVHCRVHWCSYLLCYNNESSDVGGVSVGGYGEGGGHTYRMK